MGDNSRAQWFHRVIDIIERLFSPPSVLALLAFGGFFYIATRIVERLENPPASELFTVLNLVLSLATGAAGYFFGRRSTERARDQREDE